MFMAQSMRRMIDKDGKLLLSLRDCLQRPEGSIIAIIGIGASILLRQLSKGKL